MPSCLGIYIDKNLIKYAKIKKTDTSYDIEVFGNKNAENIEEKIKEIIEETNSSKCPICTNISNELYNYFDVFSVLNRKDITNSLNIEFEMLCDEKSYDINSLESRYILMENFDNPEKYKAMYISTIKKEINEKLSLFANYKLNSMTPISTSITNLLEYDGTENIAIINLENETQITTVIDGQIRNVNILNKNIEEIIQKLVNTGLTYEDAYSVISNTIIYGKEGIYNLDDKASKYLDVIMPIIYKIAKETSKILNSLNENIDKVYITGLGATINNIDLYFQDFFNNRKCEILKPFFLDTTSLKQPLKKYIEVNSATALALDGIGFLNKELNFAVPTKQESVDANKLNFEKIFKDPLSIFEKTIIRVIILFIIAIIVFSVLGTYLVGKLNYQKNEINENLKVSTAEIAKIETEISQIESHINAYTAIINGSKLPTSTTIASKTNRIIPKGAIPTLLEKIMLVIPRKVQITSIKNVESKHLVIVATCNRYEQLIQFSNSIKQDQILQNVHSNIGENENNLFEIIIEGDLQ